MNESKTEDVKFLNEFMIFNNQICEKIKEKNKDELCDMLSVVQEFISKIDTIFEYDIYKEYIPFFELYQKFFQQCCAVSFHGIEWSLLHETQEQFIECLENICAIKQGNCKTSDKGQFIISFLKEINIIYAKEEIKLLHVASEIVVEDWIVRNCPKVKYESVNLFMDGVTFHSDIQKMQNINDESYDLFIYSHSLKNVEDEKKVLRELKRILKSDGIGIFLASGYLDQDIFDEMILMENAFLDKNKLYVLGKTDGDIQQLLEQKKIKLILDDRKELPLVSVIVSVYNAEDIIKNTIDSILHQTYQNIELIIVDDASTDSSRKVISSYKDKRIKTIFLEQNCHLCTASNIAFKEAKGKYIAIIGHDDDWQKDKLEKQISFMEANPAYGVCFTWVNIINENNDLINDDWSFLYDRFSEKNDSRVNWIRKLYFEGNYFCAPSACIKRSLLDEMGYYRYALLQLQDYDLWLRLLRKAPIYIIQERLTYYRRFSGVDKNVSALTQANENRDRHEQQWILDNFIESLSTVEFVKIFKEEKINPFARNEKEILCEKAFLLWKVNNCFAEKRFIELFEDEECRRILSKSYHFEVKDFYNLNGEPMFFDLAR